MPFRKELDPFTRWVIAGGSGKKRDWWKLQAACAEVAQEMKKTRAEILDVVIETMEWQHDEKYGPPQPDRV